MARSVRRQVRWHWAPLNKLIDVSQVEVDQKLRMPLGYVLAGIEIFSDEHPKYLEFISDRLVGLT